jgi:A/G-specific adenine glycosylase
MPLSHKQIQEFQTEVWEYYRTQARPMPWRATPTPYFVLVSEIMLQQTQVPRVLGKFAEFTRRFPDIKALADAPLRDVLAVWSGLGYNRRAKFLWQAAKAIAARGAFPQTREELMALPGIGPNTAGAILAYAYNQPVLFIETNIRTVIIHHFFAEREDKIKDSEILAVLGQVLPNARRTTLDSPRHWYWALMDYGTHVKATRGGQLHKVHIYKKQTKFEGSRRQMRGKVLRLLLEGAHTTSELATLIPDARLAEVLSALHAEGLITKANSGVWHLTA